jgi:hypothetical protein
MQKIARDKAFPDNTPIDKDPHINARRLWIVRHRHSPIKLNWTGRALA